LGLQIKQVVDRRFQAWNYFVDPLHFTESLQSEELYFESLNLHIFVGLAENYEVETSLKQVVNP
jgi:hypothetical protein